MQDDITEKIQDIQAFLQKCEKEEAQRKEQEQQGKLGNEQKRQFVLNDKKKKAELELMRKIEEKKKQQEEFLKRNLEFKLRLAEEEEKKRAKVHETNQRKLDLKKTQAEDSFLKRKEETPRMLNKTNSKPELFGGFKEIQELRTENWNKQPEILQENARDEGQENSPLNKKMAPLHLPIITRKSFEKEQVSKGMEIRKTTSQQNRFSSTNAGFGSKLGISRSFKVLNKPSFIGRSRAYNIQEDQGSVTGIQEGQFGNINKENILVSRNTNHLRTEILHSSSPMKVTFYDGRSRLNINPVATIE